MKFMTEVTNMAETKPELKRVSEYTSLMGFVSEDVTIVKVEDIAEVDFILNGFEVGAIHTPDGPAGCVTILGHSPETGEVFKFLSFSQVLVDQCLKVGESNLPVLAQITREGQGNRKYWTMK